jgi:glycerophosphoryl diester phosphodiesterase
MAAGADGVELDVRRMRDATWLVHHDKTFLSGHRRRYVADASKAEFFLPLTTMNDVVDWTRKHAQAILDVEVKMPGFEDELVDQLRPLRDQVFVTSFHPDVLWSVHHADPDLVTGFLITFGTPFALEIAQLSQARVLVWRNRSVRPDVMGQAAALGFLNFVWDVRSERRVRQLVGWGVDGVITDRVPRHTGRSAQGPARIAAEADPSSARKET